MAKQKEIYACVVFGNLKPNADGSGYELDPLGKRDFRLTATINDELLSATARARFLEEAEIAFDLLIQDVKEEKLSF